MRTFLTYAAVIVAMVGAPVGLAVFWPHPWEGNQQFVDTDGVPYPDPGERP